MFNPDEHSDHTIRVFETISSYIVDVFYNHIYKNAFEEYQMDNGQRHNSVTSVYKNTCTTYTRLFNDNESYSKTISNIHSYVCIHMHRTYTTDEFVNLIVYEFIPPNYHNDVNSSTKNITLGVVLRDVVHTFCKYILYEGGLPLIVDNRDSAKTEQVYILQDKMNEILFKQKIIEYNKFMSGDNSEVNAFKEEVKKLTQYKIKSVEAIKKLQQLCKTKQQSYENIHKEHSRVIMDLKYAKDDTAKLNTKLSEVDEQNKKLILELAVAKATVQALQSQQLPPQRIQRIQQPRLPSPLQSKYRNSGADVNQNSFHDNDSSQYSSHEDNITKHVSLDTALLSDDIELPPTDINTRQSNTSIKQHDANPQPDIESTNNKRQRKSKSSNNFDVIQDNNTDDDIFANF